MATMDFAGGYYRYRENVRVLVLARLRVLRPRYFEGMATMLRVQPLAGWNEGPGLS
jgi:hypothetical protein